MKNKELIKIEGENLLKIFRRSKYFIKGKLKTILDDLLFKK